MVDSGETSLKAYFERARRWEQDAYCDAMRSMRLWRVLAVFFACVALLSLLSITTLFPLKHVEPFVIRVDNSTGIVETLSALKDAPETYDESVERYFLAKYVTAREGFVFNEARYIYDLVSLMSAPSVQADFAQSYDGSNPESPQNVYGRKTSVHVKIISISALSEDIAQIRYLREEKSDRGVQASRWVAVMRFTFVTAEISNKDRLLNPLGFLVLEYRTSQEVTS